MPEDEIRMLGSKSIDPKQKEDRKKKMELIGLVFLVLILLYLVVTTFFKKPAKPVNPPAPAVSSTVIASSTSVISSEKATSTAETTAQTTDDNGWGSNPFSPRKSDQGGNITIQLQGVVVNGKGEAYALISNQIVKVGGRVADNTVKEIASDKVILQADTGEEVVLRR